MEQELDIPVKPKFRSQVKTVMRQGEAEIFLGDNHCSFVFKAGEQRAVERLFDQLEAGGLTVVDLTSLSPEIAEQVPHLLRDFDRLRLLIDSEPLDGDDARSGAQLYREVRRVAERVTAKIANSTFYEALRSGRATRRQLIGYALEYHWIVQAAPGLIGPALATAHSARERVLLQEFLRSELGHDRFLATALAAVGLTPHEVELHQPLPATFALGASLGVYARQHPLSFRACLFLFERAQPSFIAAFDARCQVLGLPEEFYLPLRHHADLNDNYDHEDISRALLQLEGAVDQESCNAVKRHVALLVETMIQQEETILSYYGQPDSPLPRVFA
jgi:hypothetical protein